MATKKPKGKLARKPKPRAKGRRPPTPPRWTPDWWMMMAGATIAYGSLGYLALVILRIIR